MKGIKLSYLATIPLLILPPIDILSLTDLQISGTWTEVFPSPSPGARRGAAWAYDSINNVIVLFGGVPRTSETWIYDLETESWEQKFPALSPPGRSLHAMTFDSRNGLVILFGGYKTSHSDELNDTWVYDVRTNTWRQLHPDASPPERHWPGLAYDSKNGMVVLFGGHNRFVDISQEQLNDTWLLDVVAETWTQVFPAESPSPRQTYLIYNERNGLIYAFGGKYEVDVGGQNFDLLYYNDMWSYDLSGNTWTKLLDNSSATNVPAPRRTKTAYEPVNDLVILFGGEGSKIKGTGMFRAYNDTWIYNFHTNTWAEITPTISPPGRFVYVIIYDPFNHKALLYGGDSIPPSGFIDIWELVVRTGRTLEAENTTPTKPMVPSEPTEPTFVGYNRTFLLAVGGALIVAIGLAAFFIKRQLKK